MNRHILNDIVMVGQLGLSVIMPLLMCFFGAYALIRYCGAGTWIYIPALIFGTGASWMTVYKFYIQQKKKLEKEEKLHKSAFNEHI